MVTNKKKPIPPRKAVKPPVINLKATEVKAAKSAGAKSTENTAKPAASQASKKPETKSNKPSGTTPKKPTQSGPANSKPSSSKPSSSKPQSGIPAKKSKKTVLLVSLAALIAAGVGGAWLFKEYGSKYFVTPNTVSSEQVAKLTARIGKLETAKPTPTSGGPEIKALSANFKKQIDAISGDVKTNKKALASNNKKLGAIEKSVSDLRTALNKAAKSGDQPASAANALQLKEMAEKLGAVEKTLAAVKSTPVKDNSGAVAQLQSKLSALQTNLTAAKQQAGKDNLKLNQALAELAKQAVTPKSNPASELARTFTVLRAKVTGGTAFKTELDEFAKLLPSETAIDTLRPFAEDGAPTAEMLKTGLESVSVEPPATQPKAEKGSGVFSEFSKSLSGLVKVSKVGETDWENAKVAALEALNAGKIAAAIKALSHKNATKSVSDWLALAGKKLQVDGAIDQMSGVVMARLTKSN